MENGAGPLAGILAAREAVRRRHAARLASARHRIVAAPRGELERAVSDALEEVGAEAVIDALVERATRRGPGLRAWTVARDAVEGAVLCVACAAVSFGEEVRARLAPHR